ncbi:MAG: diaminopimelate decarboxylase [Pseudomonadales bacterium]|jgi:diaminopimelate decarboxylase|nr:diaminopimelate decarboxylase [Pseudomonadales bacterium]|tara:strand:- start:2481 stop:3728 length:1248 start_codon:yes stop_codon:yes gene_type:complete
MDYFNYKGDSLLAEAIPVADIAQKYGTPCFIYSRATLERHYGVYQEALKGCPHLICFAVKANSNLAVINVLARLGAGFDIVSGGELERVIAAGGDTSKVIFSGLGKTEAEIERALQLGIYCFNIESGAELDRIDRIAQRLGKKAPISVRVNPDVNTDTHPYISTGQKENKFGISYEQAIDIYRRAAILEGIKILGIDCHIGSQLTSVEPFLDATDRLLTLTDRLANEGILLTHFDVGGGLGVTYGEEEPPHPSELIAMIRSRFANREMTLLIEPGRTISANAGIFVTKVEYLKQTNHKNFAIIDGAMNDLLRPALYGAWQEIIPVNRRQGDGITYDVVGPVCESSDFLGKERVLCIKAGDLLAVRSAGAYGFAMSSNYNTRPRSAEIMVDHDKSYLVRPRETITELFAGESCLPK